MVVGSLEVLEKFRVGGVGGVGCSIIVSLQSSLGLSTVDFGLWTLDFGLGLDFRLTIV